MNLDLYQYMPFDSKDAIDDFLGVHELAHQQIAEYLARSNKSVEQIPLSGDLDLDERWLQDHYLLHINISQQLNLGGVPDLSEVDFGSEEQLLDWMQQHSDVHDQINSVLGIYS